LPLPYLFEIVTQATAAPFFEQGSITSGMPAGNFPKGAYSLISSNPSTLRSAYVDPHPPRNYVMHWNMNVQHYHLEPDRRQSACTVDQIPSPLFSSL
jgi:hypothetical protein